MVVLKIALGAYLAFLALFTAWLRPSFFAMFWSILIGLGAGLAYSWLFYTTRYKKRLLNDGVRAPCFPHFPLKVVIDNLSCQS